MVDCANLMALSVLNPLIRAAVKVNKSETLFLLSSHPHKIESTILPGKGQLISKCLFGIFNSPKKQTKNSTLLLWYLKSNCFHSFFGRIEDTKRTFRN